MRESQIRSEVLDPFLERVGLRLGSLRRGQRVRILGDLREHLQEAIQAESGANPRFDAEGYLRDYPVDELVRSLLRAESQSFLQRALASAVGALSLGVMTIGFMRLSGRPWGHALAFGAGYGLTVGFSLFWFRNRWRTWATGRWGAAMAVGAIAALPWAFMLNFRFDAPMVFYGGVSGYLLERFSRDRRWPVWLTDNLLLTSVAFVAAGYEWRWEPQHIALRMVPWALAYHFTLQLGIFLGLVAHRRIERWFLERVAVE